MISFKWALGNLLWKFSQNVTAELKAHCMCNPATIIANKFHVLYIFVPLRVLGDVDEGFKTIDTVSWVDIPPKQPFIVLVVIDSDTVFCFHKRPLGWLYTFHTCVVYVINRIVVIFSRQKFIIRFRKLLIIPNIHRWCYRSSTVSC